MKKSEFIKSLKEIILDEHRSVTEAKKKKRSSDVAPQKDIDIDLGIKEPVAEPAAEPSFDATADTSTTGGGLDIKPEIKTIQDLLQKALVNAQQIGDEKLVKQIGNTLTMLVRTQVLGVEKQSMTAQ